MLERIYYYGGESRKNDPTYSYNTLLGTSSTDYGLLQFSSAEEAGQFLKSMSSLKGYIGDHGKQYRSGAMTLKQWREFLRKKWIPVTDLFIQKWGKHMVPIDIRSAIDDVRSHIDLPPIVWPDLVLA